MGSAIFAKLIRRDAVRAAMSAAVGAEVREAAKGDPSLRSGITLRTLGAGPGGVPHRGGWAPGLDTPLALVHTMDAKR
ncbi:hypothetical protein MANAM107_16520 [Actinomyces capricornis]|uniref:Uncharacterized protein n=1 Tax=Actinomyces capricornis TaxID=2755559 RepID=A0ABM7UC47_9ACTO|nr:hypothetical protein MANAM107_16520 [Actinomyces capricornis]